jgi:hypothetical protein
MKNPIILFFILAMFVLYIIAILGMVYLTKFSFENNSIDNKRTIELTDTELTFSKITVVLFWISFVLTAMFRLYVFFQY